MADTCPKCGQANTHGLDHCVACGIIFAKYERMMQRRGPRPARTLAVPVQRRTYRPLKFLEMKAYAQFFRRLSRLLESGLSLNRALASTDTGKRPIAPLVAHTIDRMDKGDHLIAALEQSRVAWPSFVWGHLEAGVAAGRLPYMLALVADEIEARRARILKQIFNWRTLWFFVMLLFGAGSLAITGSVRNLPAESVEKGVSGVLLGIGSGATPRFLLLMAMFIGLCCAFAWFQIRGKQFLTERHPGYENLRLNTPLFSEVLIGETLARYFSLLARLLESGLPLPKSLQLAKEDIEFPNWRERFAAVREAVERGDTLSDGFAKVPRIPGDLLAELRVGEQTGAIAEGLDHYVGFIRENVTNRRMVANVGFGVALFLLGIVLTLIVMIMGLGAWIPLYERVLSG